MTPDLSNPSEALAASVATRESVRALKPSDPARVEALTGALGLLQESWTPEHARYCRQGRQIGRSTSADPVRVAARERRAEIARVRSMLNPRSGRGRDPAPVIDNARVMRGHIDHARGVLMDIDARHETAVRALGRGSIASRKGGGRYMSMSQLNVEANELLAELSAERQALRTAWDRYYPDDKWDDFMDIIGLWRLDADRVTVALRGSARRRRPTARVEDATWTRDRILRALSKYAADHDGTLPTARQCNHDPALPAYTLMTRKLGPSPLAAAKRFGAAPAQAS